ncbi:MAG: hypothetical protein FWC20_04420 [Oscillospiraceae bacterium]|nr:hypothetical protein [Oscillospiraceae bacterium]MCL2278637.1 hypothetical protein [Oscillospiraceae bacterium]
MSITNYIKNNSAKTTKFALIVVTSLLVVFVLALISSLFAVATSDYDDADMSELKIRFTNVFSYRFDGSLVVTLFNSIYGNEHMIVLNRNDINDGIFELLVANDSVYSVTYEFLPCETECSYCLVEYTVVDSENLVGVSSVITGNDTVIVNWTFFSGDKPFYYSYIVNHTDYIMVDSDYYIAYSGNYNFDDLDMSPHGEDMPSQENIARGATLFLQVWVSVADLPAEPSFQNFFGRYFGNYGDPVPGTAWAAQVNDSIRRFVVAGGGSADDWNDMSHHDRFMQSLYWDIQYGLARELAWDYINNDFYQFLGGFDMIARFVNGGRGNLGNMVSFEAQYAYNTFMYWQRQLLLNYGFAHNFMEGYKHIGDVLFGLELATSAYVVSDNDSLPNIVGIDSILDVFGYEPAEEASFFTSLIDSLRSMWVTLTIVIVGSIALLVFYLRRRSLYIKPYKLD